MAALALVLAGGCSPLGGGETAASPSVATSPSASHSPLGQAVATPAGFPNDVPVYPGARLTAGANFAASTQNTFGMEWETVDAVSKVQAFYATSLNQGDWTISFSGATATGFTAVFSLKSNSKETGIVGADGVSGITKISLSLVVPG